MLKLEQNEEKNKEKKLMLGDYMTVHVSGVTEAQSRVGTSTPIDIQARNEGFFQRILKERKELKEMSIVQLRGAA